MRPPPSPHSNFFSSLKQVEKRLKLEQPNANESCFESLRSPLFICGEEPIPRSTLQESSGPPQAFLSQFPPTPQYPPQIKAKKDITETTDQIDGIKQLMQLLGEEKRVGLGNICDANSCHCADGFYSKIAGIKGPKCNKEMQRLDGWIKHFMNERSEPLRLAYLLLGKAACLCETQAANGGFEGLEYPSTIEDFLHNPPPVV